MSEENIESTPDEQKSRPRNKDGTFMSQTQIDKLEQKSKDAYAHLEENNKALMRGTPFNEDYFKGMPPKVVNQFLLNYHNKEAAKPPEEPEKESNTPILGTPVGSGKAKYYLDNFLTMDPKAREIDFTAPASVVFEQQKNQNEATKKWLDRR